MSTSSEPEVVIYGLQNYQQIVEAWREIVTNGYRSPAVVTLLTGFRETPACEGCCHNANCFSGITPEVLAYFYLRSTGEIAERPDYEWGCKHPDLIFGRDRIFRSQVQIEFQEVDWNKGFTCRGFSKKSLRASEEVGPGGESSMSENARIIKSFLDKFFQEFRMNSAFRTEGFATQASDMVERTSKRENQGQKRARDDSDQDTQDETSDREDKRARRIKSELHSISGSAGPNDQSIKLEIKDEPTDDRTLSSASVPDPAPTPARQQRLRLIMKPHTEATEKAKPSTGPMLRLFVKPRTETPAAPGPAKRPKLRLIVKPLIKTIEWAESAREKRPRLTMNKLRRSMRINDVAAKKTTRLNSK